MSREPLTGATRSWSPWMAQIGRFGVPQAVGLFGVSAATDRDGRRELVRKLAGQGPGAIASHRDADHVNPGDIHGVLPDDLIDHRQDVGQRVDGFSLRAFRQVSPGKWREALRSQNITGVFFSPRTFQKQVRYQAKLMAIVPALFP